MPRTPKAYRGHKSIGHRGPRRAANDDDIDMLGAEPPRAGTRRESYPRAPRGPSGPGRIPSWRGDHGDAPTSPRQGRGGHHGSSHGPHLRRLPPLRDTPNSATFNSDCSACTAMVRLNRDFSRNLRTHMETFFHKLYAEIERWADDVGVGNGRSFDPMDWQMEMTTRIIERERRPSERRCSYMRIVSSANTGGIMAGPVHVPVAAPPLYALTPRMPDMHAAFQRPTPIPSMPTTASQSPNYPHGQPSMPAHQQHHQPQDFPLTNQGQVTTPSTIYKRHTCVNTTPRQTQQQNADYTTHTHPPQQESCKSITQSVPPSSAQAGAQDCIDVTTTAETAPNQFMTYRETNSGDSSDGGQGSESLLVK
ncbi:hypothetical protein OQA88_4923 [Cercophora sp. LCS_1]